MRNTIKLRIVLATAIVAALASGAVWADSPHFVGKVKATLGAGGTTVQVCWKEAGLGSNASISYIASATATATYNCVNGGGNCPNAANKTTVTEPVSASGQFSSGKNGSITACLTFNAPSAGSFTCPGGQTVTLTQAAYTGIQVSDDTNGITAAATPSSLTANPFLCP
jgi:hypothetical protein